MSSRYPLFTARFGTGSSTASLENRQRLSTTTLPLKNFDRHLRRSGIALDAESPEYIRAVYSDNLYGMYAVVRRGLVELEPIVTTTVPVVGSSNLAS
ncbi:hypothetical protein PM082_004837 [Marasmius tenuissimus]|nr:hypothetical protein PM082_004837 [Marasmius tenuissimus]